MKHKYLTISLSLCALLIATSGCSSVHAKTPVAEASPKARVAQPMGGGEEFAANELPSLSPVVDPSVLPMTNDLDRDLKVAFDYICAQYGNPTVVRIFCNDPVKGAELQQRLAALPKLDSLNAEVAKLNGTIARQKAAIAAFQRLAREAVGQGEQQPDGSNHVSSGSETAVAATAAKR